MTKKSGILLMVTVALESLTAVNMARYFSTQQSYMIVSVQPRLPEIGAERGRNGASLIADINLSLAAPSPLRVSLAQAMRLKLAVSGLLTDSREFFGNTHPSHLTMSSSLTPEVYRCVQGLRTPRP